MTSADFRAARQSLGLSQQKLADALGLTKRTVIRYENGNRIPEPVAIALRSMVAAKGGSDGVATD